MSLVIKNLSKTFENHKQGKVSVLQNVSLDVDGGEIVSIVGPSGCGKSTLLDCIAGLEQPTNGTIQAAALSYMTQDTCMFPWRTILQNIALPLEIQGISPSSASKKAQSLLQTFHLEKWAQYYPGMLSGGMLQRASLMRAYISNKKLLLLDEPFGKLDALTKLQAQQWFLHTITKKKISVLFVTHDIDEAIFISDRIYVVSARPGKIKAEFHITLPRPRKTSVMTSVAFTNAKKQILHTLQV